MNNFHYCWNLVKRVAEMGNCLHRFLSVEGLSYGSLRIVILGILLLLVGRNRVIAQTLPPTIPMSEATCVSPYYFGPNAFPIPDMLLNTSADLRVELAGDYYNGHRGGHTEDIFVKANIPLWTRRANLSLWWAAMEFYQKDNRSSSVSGDIYLSIDIQILEEKRYRPNLTLRAALKTASGGSYEYRRYYDSPGYFFDAYVSKSFPVGKVKLMAGVGGGFLCWQTANGRQNDAIMYGLAAGIRWKAFSLLESFGGYCGWEGMSCKDKYLAHDRPMSLKTTLSYQIKKWEIIGMVQCGLKDYPYTQVRLGVAHRFNVLGKIGKKR